VHEALIAQTQKNRLVGHISRDSTAIEARENPLKLAAAEKTSLGVRARENSGQRRKPAASNASRA
jgi:hypothetical protein